MTPRVSPKERIRSQIDELIATSTTGSLLEKFEEVARLAVRLVMQTALEAEVTEFLGRERYQRAARERAGSRNGYSSTTIKPLPARSPSSALSCGAPMRASPPGCWEPG